jgi:hypothetical protein
MIDASCNMARSIEHAPQNNGALRLGQHGEPAQSALNGSGGRLARFHHRSSFWKHGETREFFGLPIAGNNLDGT